MKYIFAFLFLSLFSYKAQATCTTEIHVDGAIGASTLDYLQRAQHQALQDKCDSMLMLINTPGGSLQSTRLIVEEILNSPIPYLCLVYPDGAHAGSAGAIILQACHVAGAMATTNIGAATPIASTGQEMPEDLKKKLFNDTTSWLEGIVKLRKRDKDFAEKIVTEAKAVDAKTALEIGAIEVVPKNIEEFLQFSQDREVKLSEDKTIKVAVGARKLYQKDFRAQILDLIADPQVSYLMFMGSLGLLYFEITHPGTIVPGVVGSIGLVLSLVSMHKMNVTWGAVALLVLGLLLMIAEAFVPSFGMLGVGGIASFILGSVFLFDPVESGYSLPFTIITPTALVLGLFTMLLAYLAFQTRNFKVRGEYNELIDHEGTVVSLKNPKQGLIEVNGERWKFISEQELTLKDQVKVVSHKGFILIVEKI